MYHVFNDLYCHQSNICLLYFTEFAQPPAADEELILDSGYRTEIKITSPSSWKSFLLSAARKNCDVTETSGARHKLKVST